MQRPTILILLPLLAISGSARAIETNVPATPWNKRIVTIVDSMPRGGGYSASAQANKALGAAVSTDGGTIVVDASKAVPSYCSEATYLVFLKLLAGLPGQDQPNHGSLGPNKELDRALRPHGQRDGAGIWGRWNANGPGTAALFFQQALGRNFTDLKLAVPGDFLKIFWNDKIGASEHGHSVIFLGTDPAAGTLTYWSSNIPDGYGKKTVPLTRVKRLLFSRLEHPERITSPKPWLDIYLSGLEHASSPTAVMERMAGITGTGSSGQQTVSANPCKKGA